MTTTTTHYIDTGNSHPACEGYRRESIPTTEGRTYQRAKVTCAECLALMEADPLHTPRPVPVCFNVGDRFIHTIRNPWGGKGQRGTETHVLEIEITKLTVRGTQFDWKTIRRISCTDPLPGTTGRDIHTGGMTMGFARDLMAKGELKAVARG